MSQVLSYSKITDARSAIADIYDNAVRNLVVNITREDDPPVVVLKMDSLIPLLSAQCVFEPKAHFSDDGGVSIWLEGLPVSAQGESLGEAESELIQSLRDFAEIWVEDLREYPNHRDNWVLPTLVRLVKDDEHLHQLVFGNE